MIGSGGKIAKDVVRGTPWSDIASQALKLWQKGDKGKQKGATMISTIFPTLLALTTAFSTPAIEPREPHDDILTGDWGQEIVVCQSLKCDPDHVYQTQRAGRLCGKITHLARPAFSRLNDEMAEDQYLKEWGGRGRAGKTFGTSRLQALGRPNPIDTSQKPRFPNLSGHSRAGQALEIPGSLTLRPGEIVPHPAK